MQTECYKSYKIKQRGSLSVHHLFLFRIVLVFDIKIQMIFIIKILLYHISRWSLFYL